MAEVGTLTGAARSGPARDSRRGGAVTPRSTAITGPTPAQPQPHDEITGNLSAILGGDSGEIAGPVRAEEELQRYAERLRALSRQLIEAQEAERRRIARDLHDQVGQALTAIKIDLQLARHRAENAEEGGPHPMGPERESPHDAFAKRLGKSIEMVERTIQQVREFSLDLRPSILDDLGLPSALLWYADEQACRGCFVTEFAVEQFPTRLSPELEITCFRIAQEAITNVVRHARARHVWVELRRNENELLLTIRDDGVGFDMRSLASVTRREAGGTYSLNRIGTLGLAGMHERAGLVGGSLSIQSAPDAGTTVRAVFPLGAMPSESTAGYEQAPTVGTTQGVWDRWRG